MQTKSPTTATPGNWPSDITSELIVTDSISIAEPVPGPDAIFYIERRPEESGRCVIVKADNGGDCSDMLPAPYSARSRVHEYGGGSYCIHGDDIFFINDSDQDIYQIRDRQIIRISDENNTSFADLSFDPARQRIIAICETHLEHQTVNSIVGISLADGEINALEQGDDFYASPRLNSRADKLCWQSWNHPEMPWDGNRLWLAELNADGNIINRQHIAGAKNIAVFQPQWSPDDKLYFIADDSGWWHIYRHTENGVNQQLTQGEKEFGLPQWVFAQSSYSFIDKDTIICQYQSEGRMTLASLSIAALNLCDIKTCWTYFDAIRANNNGCCFIAASGSRFPQLLSASLDDNGALDWQLIKATNTALSDEYYSIAQNIVFSNRHRQQVHAFYYPPTNPQIDSRCQNQPPPLIVICHGGPTGQSSTALDPKKQFWTSRGFALLDVNYSGSTGYGRQYRERLNSHWGVLDVSDCCDAALYAVSQGWANKDQLIIRGSSAGGYTVLSALTFENVFSAGASYYGISDLTTLAEDTHKFESRYLDRLVGPYPESKALYRKRSPINSTQQLNCPVIFFQGLEDRVVPKEQAEMMVAALDDKGLPVAAQYYAGEQHGFRKADTIIQSLENELSFYQLVFQLKDKDEIEFIGEIEIKNI